MSGTTSLRRMRKSLERPRGPLPGVRRNVPDRCDRGGAIGGGGAAACINASATPLQHPITGGRAATSRDTAAAEPRADATPVGSAGPSDSPAAFVLAPAAAIAGAAAVACEARPVPG